MSQNNHNLLTRCYYFSEYTQGYNSKETKITTGFGTWLLTTKHYEQKMCLCKHSKFPAAGKWLGLL